MEKLHFAEPNKLYSNNEIKRTKQYLFSVPFTTIFRYFFWNYENIYFLILSIFQLLTGRILPKEWSPTGPYSTAVPLLICILIEISSNIVRWLREWFLDKMDNSKSYNLVTKDGTLIQNWNKLLYPGVIINLKKDDVCPVDGILIDTTNNEKYSKISLALLTGESNIHYIVKPNKLFKLINYKDSYLTINNNFQTDFKNFEGSITKKDGITSKVSGESFIVAGSIIKSNDVYIWITGCGKDKKSYFKNNIKNDRKKSRIDNFIGRFMMDFNAYLLLFLVFGISTLKSFFITINSVSISSFIFYCVQNWILFNGVIPFSVKIFILLSRSLQSFIINRNENNITIMTPLLIDDLGKVNKILTDKTGTLTKNELEFSKIIQTYSNIILDVETFNKIKNYKDINSELHKCLGLCVHFSEGDYSTPEDRTISSRYHYLCNSLKQDGDHVVLNINGEKFNFNYIEIGGLDFTFERRLSSKIVKDQNNNYFIYCKGAIDSIGIRLKHEFKNELKRIEEIISKTNPDLRLLACGFREIDPDEFLKISSSSNNKSQLVKNLENNLQLLGILGIKDNLQEGVKDTILKLKNYGLNCCMLTGDRKMTALAVAKEAGIIDNEDDIVDMTIDPSLTCIPRITTKTLLFNGNFIDHIIKNSTTSELSFELLQKCKNFIGSDLIPEHKKKITNILESRNTLTMTIGDGFNDIGMFNVSSVSVSIKGNSNVESNSDFSISEFKYLSDLFNISIDTYYRNSFLTNFIFYRCVSVVFSLVTFTLINYNKITTSLFGGFVLQAFNFAWTAPGTLYYVLKNNYKQIKYNKGDYYKSKLLTLVCDEYTTLWNIEGLVFGLSNLIITYYWFGNSLYFEDIVAFFLILGLNIKIILKNRFDLLGIILTLTGVTNFLFYLWFKGSFGYVIDIVLNSEFSVLFFTNYFLLISFTNFLLT